MTTYTKATNFASKDSLVSGNPLKTLKGTELDDEFNLLAVASATKANIASPTFTGVPAAPTATAGTVTTQVATTAFVGAAVTAVGIGSYLPKTGGAMTGAITTNSTFDGVDIATRDAVLTTTADVALQALPKAGGAMTGAITTNSTFDGRNVATDGTKLDTLVIGTSIQAYDATILVDADIGTSVLAPTGDGSSLTGVFPTQTSNAGKFLTTDGSAASWASSASGPTDAQVRAKLVNMQVSNWQSRTSATYPTVVNLSWTCIAWNGTVFAAIQTAGLGNAGNKVMSSPDGVTWTIRAGPGATGDRYFQAIAWNGSLFATVASGGSATTTLVMTSPDGITWTSRTTPNANNWYGIAWNGTVFAAVASSGTGNRVMTSTNGTSWTSRTSAADNSWRAIAWNGTVFAAVAASGTGNRVMTSPDGITWTSRTSAANNSWRAIAWNGTIFAAVAASGTGNRVMTSPDGITWTSRTSAADNNWDGIAWNGTVFCAVASSGTNRVMTSPDGITWTSRTSAADDKGWKAIAWNGLGTAPLYLTPAKGTGTVFSAVATDAAMTSLFLKDE